MARRTVLEVKPSGLSSQFATEDENFVYQSHQDVTPVIEHCKTLGEQTPGKEMRHIAEIPLVIYQKGLREGWINDKKKLKQLLINPDNRLFRTWKGRV